MQSVNIVNDNVIPDDVVQTDQKAVENIEPELVAEVPGSIESAEDAKSEKSVNEVDIQKPEEEAEKETVKSAEIEEVVKPQTPTSDKVADVDAVEGECSKSSFQL